MIKHFVCGGAAMALFAAAGAPANATPVKKGYGVNYLAERHHYCITPLSRFEAYRLGIALYRTECHSIEDWATMGVKFSGG